MHIYRGVDISIPGRVNITIALSSFAVAIFLLWLASHADSLALMLLAAVGFSFVGNTIFSLLHESVHNLFHEKKKINDAFGRLSAAFFPTGYSFHRICHLGHHRRNRTDEELFDYYKPGDNRIIKCYRLYSLLTGFYWLSIPTGCLLLLLFRNLVASDLFKTKIVRGMGLEPMLTDLVRAQTPHLRVEIVFTIFFQIILIYTLNLSLSGWLVCYVAFALNWSALQYTDHAWTVRDIKNGAWNLKVNKLVLYIFLNYHHHLAHHQHPNVPWIHLHRFVDFLEPRPSFVKTYLSLWKGPRLTLAPAPGKIDLVLEEQLDRSAHS